MDLENQKWNQILSYLIIRIEQMHPAYFAFAMATGIVALSSYQHGLNEIALILSWANIFIYLFLWILFLLRFIFFKTNIVEDLKSHLKAPAFFTMVAATSVLGSQLAIVHQMKDGAQFLWWTALVLWTLCTYIIFSSLILKKNKPSLENGINGGWLIAIVGTQSIAVLGCTLNVSFLENKDLALFILLSFWLFGGMLYIWIISLIFYRYMFFNLSPSDILPPYWINMGAVAISTLAGSLLSNLVRSSKVMGHLYPFIEGLTIMFWATATWWIPILLILGIWRHYFNKVSISYDPLYWGLVFPFGMYSACTLQLSKTLELFFLIPISKTFIMIAICVWFTTFLGYLGKLIQTPFLAKQNLQKIQTAEKSSINNKP